MHGHDVHIAHDGEQAVEAAARLRPEVVLLDIGLPARNGYETARRIREQQGSDGVLLVAVTGWGQDEARCLSHEVGFDAHLVKPVTLDAITNLLPDVEAARPRRGQRK
jgi:DNA-binding response OmpR family regulator